MPRHLIANSINLSFGQNKTILLTVQAGIGVRADTGIKLENAGRDGDKIDLSLPITSTYLRKMRGVSSDGPHWPQLHPVLVVSSGSS